MKRSPLKRGKRLSPVSDKRRAELERRREIVDATLLRDRGCIARDLVPHVRCGGHVDVHERIPRARGGDWLDLANTISLCRMHHDWVHDHPIEATDLGLLASKQHNI